jgi:dihydroorotate dehydrogenase
MYRQLANAGRKLGADAETMHDLGLNALARASQSPMQLRLIKKFCRHIDPRLQVTNPFGSEHRIVFRNPLGVAAGLDKNGIAVPALCALGFGHAEVGTVTPLPQSGRDRPRVFALPQDGALINRMGFPGEGMDVVEENLSRTNRSSNVIGINVGPNADSVADGFDRTVDDYRIAADRMIDLADYVTVNPSSPNTTGLREVIPRFGEVMSEVDSVRKEHRLRTPILVKFAPVTDVGWKATDSLLQILKQYEGVGIIMSNTNVIKPPLLSRKHYAQMGGLSGPPQALATLLSVMYAYEATEGSMTIVATGGDHGPWTEKLMRGGATLVQSYTNLVYHGPTMPVRALRHLSKTLDDNQMGTIKELVGIGN